MPRIIHNATRPQLVALGGPGDLFADQVNAATYRHSLEGNRIPDKAMAVQNRYRQLLRRAHRFVLDDDSTRLICHLSHEVDRLEAWSFLARLPHDPLWVEMNLHAKVGEFERMGTLIHPFVPNEVAQRMGVLMYRDDPTGESPRWIAHLFMDYENCPSTEVKLGFGIAAYLFDPEANPKAPVDGSTFWKRPTVSRRPGFPKMPIQLVNKNNPNQKIYTSVDAEIAATGMFDLPDSFEVDARPDGSFDTDAALTAPPWLASRIAVIIDPWWEAYVRPTLTESKLRNATLEAVHEDRGTLRWLVTMLAAINGLPKTMRPVHPTRARRVIGMNQVPFFEHHNLSITIPGEERRHRARQLMDAATNREVRHRRWHMVRGFWRVVEYGKSTHVCRHEPVMVESGLGMCQKCELLVRWIEPQERGNEALGVVDKTYQVTT